MQNQYSGGAVGYNHPHVVNVPPPSAIFHVNAVKNIGITQIIFGTITTICGIISLITAPEFWFSISGTGIWAGLFIIVTGVLCVVAAANPERYGTKCAALTFNIISVFMAFIAGVMGCIGIASSLACSPYCRYVTYSYYPYTRRYVCSYDYCRTNTGASIISICISLMMTVEFILAIISAVYTGRGCCGGSYGQGIIMQQQYPAAGTVYVNQSTDAVTQAPPYSAASYPQSTGYQPQNTGYQPQYQYTQAPMATQAQATGQAGVTYGADYNQKPNMAANQGNIAANQGNMAANQPFNPDQA